MRHAAPLLVIIAAAACARNGGEAGTKAAAAGACSGDSPTVTDAWVRAAADGQGTTAAYFTICNGAAEAVELVGIDTLVADTVELHETARDASGVASMAPIAGVTLQPDETAAFSPGGKHVMLIGVHDGLEAGGTAALTLHFSDGSKVTVEAPVKAQGAAEPHEGH